MSKFLEVCAGVFLIFLGVGAMVHVMDSGHWWVLVILVAMVGGLFRKCRRDPEPHPGQEAGGRRTEELEKRMNDLQDMVLGLDDKLNRLARKMDSPPSTTAADGTSSVEERSS